MKTLYFCFLLSALCFRASGQFAINWHTIDGGGGTSTGGVYSVSGTIGQRGGGDLSREPPDSSVRAGNQGQAAAGVNGEKTDWPRERF